MINIININNINNIFYALFLSVIIPMIIYRNNIKKWYKFKQIEKAILNYEKKNNTNLIIINDRISSSNIFDIDDDNRFVVYFNNLNYESVEIILHTNGGSVSSSDIIIKCLEQYNGMINVYVPYYSYSAGTLIAMAADKIYMDDYSFLSCIDPQIEYTVDDNDFVFSSYDLINYNRRKCSLSEFAIINNAQRLHNDNIQIIKRLQKNNKKKHLIISTLASGKNPHHRPFSHDELIKFGLNIEKYIPNDIKVILDKILLLS